MINTNPVLLLFSVFVLLASCSKKKSTLDCSNWKTGEFVLVDETRDLLIERTATEQIETDRKTGTFTEFKIQWMNDCTYRLYFKAGEERFLEVWETNFLEVTILRPTNDGYAYQARFSNSDKIENYEIVKIK